MYITGRIVPETIVWKEDQTAIRADVATDIGTFPVKVKQKFLQKVGWDGESWQVKEVPVRVTAKIAIRKR